MKHHAEAIVPFHPVVVIYAHPDPEKTSAIEHTVENGVTIYRKAFRVRTSGPLRLFNPLVYLLTIIRLWKRVTADGHHISVVHVHVLTRTALLAYFLKLRHGIPYIVTEHWSRYLPANAHLFNGWLRKWLTRFLARQAFVVTAVTKALQQAMNSHKISNERQAIVPNVVDIQRFKPSGTAPAVKTLLHIGSFDEPAKNVNGILRTISKLAAKRSDFIFKFVGDGPDWDKNREYAQQLGIPAENIEFTGPVMGDALVTLYNESTAFVLFSNYETQGIVLLEAFACGIPVIASSVGGIPEIMDPERGILVEPGNEQQLEAALITILDGNFAVEKDRLRNYIAENFSNEAVGRQFHEWYNRALQA